MYELYLLVGLVCMILLEILWLRRRSEDALKTLGGTLPPGTLGLPVIGETVEFAKKKLRFFTERHQQYGSVFKTNILGKPVIRVCGSENLRKIIQGENKLVQACWPASVRKLIGEENLSQCHGKDHKAKKTQLMKYLCPDYLNRHIPMFAETIRSKFRKWSTQPSVDLYVECRKLFIEVAAKYLVTLDIEEDDVNSIREQLEIFTNNMFVLPVYFPGFGFYKALNAKRKLREIFVRVLNKSKTTPDALSSVLDDYQDSTSGELDAEKDRLFLDSVIELLFFGSETVSSAGFSILYMLAKHEKYAEKLTSHISECNHLDDIDETLCARDLREMTYAESIVNETLRMLPPVGGAYRKVIESFELEGYTIPEGWSVAIGIRDTHLNAKSSEDTAAFNPDRWSDVTGGRDRFGYLPFGGGARQCPGRAYARSLLKVLTTELGRNFKVELLSDSGLEFWPTPRPRTTVEAKVTQKSGYQD